MKMNNLNRRNIFFCICGPSASGKSTISRALVHSLKGLKSSISTTTRPPRAEEEEGRDYYFITRSEFLRRRDEGYFLESAEVSGNLYGTGRENIDNAQREGVDLIFDIDVQGVKNLRKLYPRDLVVIFIYPPSRAVLEDRLRTRGSETASEIKLRLETALLEVKTLSSPEFSDYLLINDEFNSTLHEAQGIVTAERNKMNRISDNFVRRLYEE